MVLGYEALHCCDLDLKFSRL